LFVRNLSSLVYFCVV